MRSYLPVQQQEQGKDPGTYELAPKAEAATAHTARRYRRADADHGQRRHKVQDLLQERCIRCDLAEGAYRKDKGECHDGCQKKI